MKNETSFFDNTELIAELLKAKDECNNPLEEEGGIIIHNEDNEQYKFVKIKNKYNGTATAIGLYEADVEEFSSKVISKLSKGWKMYASFHTHPTFPPTPSQLDVSTLFEGFMYNFIYSPLEMKYSCCCWVGNILARMTVEKEALEQIVETNV